jgi:hypothetical protein
MIWQDDACHAQTESLAAKSGEAAAPRSLTAGAGDRDYCVSSAVKHFRLTAFDIDLFSASFAQPDHAISPSAIADQAIDASHLDMICIVPDLAERYRCPDLLDLGDHLDRSWKPLAYIGGWGRQPYL